MNTRPKRIRLIVSKLLRKYDIQKAPVPVEQIARGEGISIRKHRQDRDEFSGLVVRLKDQIIIGVNESHAEVRQRFTIGHELGHVLLHSASLDQPHVDRSFAVWFRDSGVNRNKNNVEEREANLFAAELLIPEAFITRDLQDDKLGSLDLDLFVEKLAKRYKVSNQAMAIRLAQLGYRL